MKQPVFRERIEHRLTPVAVALIRQLSQKTGLGKSAVVETAIRQFAKREKIRDPK